MPNYSYLNIGLVWYLNGQNEHVQFLKWCPNNHLKWRLGIFSGLQMAGTNLAYFAINYFSLLSYKTVQVDFLQI
jgi:hypothetical protein